MLTTINLIAFLRLNQIDCLAPWSARLGSPANPLGVALVDSDHQAVRAGADGVDDAHLLEILDGRADVVAVDARQLSKLGNRDVVLFFLVAVGLAKNAENDLDVAIRGQLLQDGVEQFVRNAGVSVLEMRARLPMLFHADDLCRKPHHSPLSASMRATLSGLRALMRRVNSAHAARR